MELDEIKTLIESAEMQERLKAITALKDQGADVAVPLLLSKRHDPEFLVRSFVAMGLGRKRNADAFAALLEMLKFDRDTNVRAEAANSISLFGDVSIPHLVMAFHQNENWLVRRSILAVLVDMECPDELWEVAAIAIEDEDFTVQESGIDALGLLAHTPHGDAALEALLARVDAELFRVRMRVAYALKRFEDPRADAALNTLRHDSDHRVVGAALEPLLPDS